MGWCWCWGGGGLSRIGQYALIEICAHCHIFNIGYDPAKFSKPGLPIFIGSAVVCCPGVRCGFIVVLIGCAYEHGVVVWHIPPHNKTVIVSWDIVFHIDIAGVIPAIVDNTGHSMYPCVDGCPVIISFGSVVGDVVVGFDNDSMRLMMLLYMDW